jgi:hypothetical protein
VGQIEEELLVASSRETREEAAVQEHGVLEEADQDTLSPSWNLS